VPPPDADHSPARHVGHADILREAIDGQTGATEVQPEDVEAA